MQAQLVGAEVAGDRRVRGDVRLELGEVADVVDALLEAADEARGEAHPRDARGAAARSRPSSARPESSPCRSRRPRPRARPAARRPPSAGGATSSRRATPPCRTSRPPAARRPRRRRPAGARRRRLWPDVALAQARLRSSSSAHGSAATLARSVARPSVSAAESTCALGSMVKNEKPTGSVASMSSRGLEVVGVGAGAVAPALGEHAPGRVVHHLDRACGCVRAISRIDCCGKIGAMPPPTRAHGAHVAGRREAEAIAEAGRGLRAERPRPQPLEAAAERGRVLGRERPDQDARARVALEARESRASPPAAARSRAKSARRRERAPTRRKPSSTCEVGTSCRFSCSVFAHASTFLPESSSGGPQA